MNHNQIHWGTINAQPFTLYYDYDQIWDTKLTLLSDDAKIEWFLLRMKFVFLEPLSRLYAGKSPAYRALNSTKAGDSPPSSFVIAAFSVLLNGIEALGSFLTPPDSTNRANFYAFIENYLKAWDTRVPQSPYPTDKLKEILWKYFRNGIAHGFCIAGGGIDNEADAPPGWRVANGRFQIGPNAFFQDFTTAVAAFFQAAATVNRANFIRRFQEVYPN